MGRRTKSKKPPPAIRGIVSENVERLRNQVFRGERSDTDKNKALAKAAGTSLSQIQRVIACDVGTSIDIIDSLARVFEVRPQDLLTPYYYSPQHDLGASQQFAIHDIGKSEHKSLQRR